MTQRINDTINDRNSDAAMAWIDQRLTRDAERLVEPSEERRIERVMRAIDYEAPVQAIRPWRHRFAIPALAAAFALAALPIVIVALRPPARAPVVTDGPTTTASIGSMFTAIEGWRWPEIPDTGRQSFAQLMRLATPEGLESQTKALIQEGRQWAEHFAQAIPASLRSFDPPQAPAPDDPAAQTSAVMPSPIWLGA